jgi:hypothetical protein
MKAPMTNSPTAIALIPRVPSNESKIAKEITLKSTESLLPLKIFSCNPITSPG